MSYLVLDTNVLIDHLNVLRWFSEDIEAMDLPMKIIVPRVVLSELDGYGSRIIPLRCMISLLMHGAD